MGEEKNWYHSVLDPQVFCLSFPFTTEDIESVNENVVLRTLGHVGVDEGGWCVRVCVVRARVGDFGITLSTTHSHPPILTHTHPHLLVYSYYFFWLLTLLLPFACVGCLPKVVNKIKNSLMWQMRQNNMVIPFGDC
jgi:hypothetical protein